MSLKGTDQWPNVVRKEQESEARYLAIFSDLSLDVGTAQVLAAASMKEGVSIGGKRCGKTARTIAEPEAELRAKDVEIATLRMWLYRSNALLREIDDSGYIKTKITSNETHLEERVDQHIEKLMKESP